MADQARLILLQPEGTTSGFDWIGKLTDAISRLPSVREKITQIVEFRRNAAWGKKVAEGGYRPKPFTGALSIYSSDVEGLKELVSTILKENEIKDSPPVWFVGYEETKINKIPKDRSTPLVKFFGLLPKHPNLTTPQFHSTWSGPHAAILLDQPLTQQKVITYKQFHSSPELTKDFTQLGLSSSAEECEGVGELGFDTLEDLEAVFCNPQYNEDVLPHLAVLIDLQKSGVMIGLDSVIE